MSGKGIRCSSAPVAVLRFAANSGAIDAAAGAVEVCGDGAWRTLVALPSRTGSRVSSTIPFMILEVDAPFNLEHFAGTGNTALRVLLRAFGPPGSQFRTRQQRLGDRTALGSSSEFGRNILGQEGRELPHAGVNTHLGMTQDPKPHLRPLDGGCDAHQSGVLRSGKDW